MTKAIITLVCLINTFYLLGQSLDTIIYKGASSQHINIVILGDGYTSANHAANKLNTDALNFANALLLESPYKEYANFFNFFIIKRNSSQTGTDHPGTATDVMEPFSPIQSRNTAYNTSLDYSDIHRLLVPDAGGKSLALLDAANLFPNFDQLIMLVNDQAYGGSGDPDLAVSSLEATANEIGIHEMGHSFANLADEYYAGDVFSAEKANMTKNTNPGTVRWKNWYNESGIGIYQHTCPLVAPATCTGNPDYDDFAQWYKPHNDCKMQFLGSNFCAVCKETIIDKMYNLVDPFSNKIPNSSSLFAFNGYNTQFGSDLILTTPNTYKIEWYLNGNLLQNRTNSKEFFAFEDFIDGNNTLILRVIDQTNMSRSYLPSNGYQFSLSWLINKIDLCTSLVDQFDYRNSFPPGSESNQPQGDDFDWTLGTGPTPSSGTGPSAAFDGNTYLFIEATGNLNGKEAIFGTECFDISGLNKPVFRIYHHMYGLNIGKLEILVSANGGLNFTSAYSIEGNQGDVWQQAEIDLSPYKSPYTRFAIIATTADGFQGDIAIDLMEIIDECPDSRNLLGLVHNHSETFKAMNTLTSTSTTNIGNVTYQAGSSVNLNKGFSVNQGATFTAQIGGCN